ncbi:MAG TPA: dodecin family protein [Solirubrobacterales bacterium]|jgi:flavin-binding protein dodecin|nr:dodecin family protein [Solirubrobacterales bacterium]
MSVAKVIEISTDSPTSFEDAIKSGIVKASQSVRNIKSAWVKEQEVRVDGDSITEYRVVLKITFVLE